MYTYNNMLYKHNKTHFSDFETGFFAFGLSSLFKIDLPKTDFTYHPIITFLWFSIEYSRVQYSPKINITFKKSRRNTISSLFMIKVGFVLRTLTLTINQAAGNCVVVQLS